MCSDCVFDDRLFNSEKEDVDLFDNSDDYIDCETDIDFADLEANRMVMFFFG